MTAISATSVHETHAERKNYLNRDSSFMSWAGTLDHKRIGLMYLTGVMFAFLVGGLFALLVRLHLWDATVDVATGVKSGGLFEPGKYNQYFTMHGVFMVFMFIIPAIPASLGNFALPLMLGAKDVALPRLNLASFYLWLAGTIMAIASMLLGQVDTGWTFYTPYSIYTQKAVVMMGLSVFVLGFSSIFTGLNFIVTTHKLRAPGQGWFRMPLFVWAVYATALLQVVATPVLGVTVLLLGFERLYHIGIFDPQFGGDPVLFQHFFWFYSHPAVYIMILPAMGIMSEVVSVFSRKPIFGYRLIAFSSLAIAIISFIVWGHHMFTSGQSELALFLFSFLTFFVALPSAIKEFNWVATIWKGSISLEAPMLYALSFLVIFAIGGLTGVILGTLNLDIHLHDTYFVVAHFHYVMMGSTAMAFFAGLHYWWPKMFGVMYSRFWATIGALVIFIGFNATFIPQFVMGSMGMPRRYAHYVPEFQGYHQASTIGALLLATGIAIMVGYLLASLFGGKKAEGNPWGSPTLDWTHTSTPPVLENFDDQPIVEREPYDYTLILEEAKQRVQNA
ncbi:MAG: cbb3-type cytochrome c oxidase subunit I [Planctomycetes bacterium]|nr:cbb3-type cytochrome c oxidase subunit I [Planctomycetota bacterium]MCB9888140.1 cbb3-type cytochrome c oxidase subunit I [Planctomycetota bacterium]